MFHIAVGFVVVLLLPQIYAVQLTLEGTMNNSTGNDHQILVQILALLEANALQQKEILNQLDTLTSKMDIKTSSVNKEIPLTSTSKIFKYEGKPFEGGLFGYLSTIGNPHDDGTARVSCNTLNDWTLSGFVNNGSNPLIAHGHPSWFQVDLGRKKRLMINYYCLRSSSEDNFHYPYDWSLEGSLTAKEDDWKILRSHTKEDSLKGANAEWCWAIDTVDAGFNNYRYIRVRGGSKKKSYFTLCAMEVYGTVIVSPRNTAF